MKPGKINWSKELTKAEHAEAEKFLSLIYNTGEAAKLVKKLRSASVSQFHIRDISRASRLLVRHQATAQVIVADGYHRLCAVYSIAEDTFIPCKIV